MRKWVKKGLWTFIILFIVLNIIAIFHSYKFTHFSGEYIEKTKDPAKLTGVQKIKTLVFGISNPRPLNVCIPGVPFETIRLKSNKEIECWMIRTASAKGTVIIFHGYSGQKSSMLDKAYIFQKLGYNTLLVDFMGSGGSEGDLTTIGFLEAEQVKTCFEYLVKNGEKNIYLFGTSMGAAAIMKALNDYPLHPEGIIIECPFGSMYQTVCARFKTLNAPTFPMAGLLVFWGGVQNGFWAFGHNPAEYATGIRCPALLIYGARDDKVSKQETRDIFSNLAGPKQLKIYPDAGHENYLLKYKNEWTIDIDAFIKAKGK